MSGSEDARWDRQDVAFRLVDPLGWTLKETFRDIDTMKRRAKDTDARLKRLHSRLNEVRQEIPEGAVWELDKMIEENRRLQRRLDRFDMCLTDGV